MNRDGPGFARLVVVVVLLTAIATTGGCGRKRPQAETKDAWRTSVHLEGTQAENLRPRITPTITPWAGRLFPPVYFDAGLPEYPPNEVHRRLPPVRVRVDFLIGVDGRPVEIRGRVLGELDEPEAFLRASESTVGGWRFSPAWRLARNEEEGDGYVVPVEYKAHLVFRFDADSTEAQMQGDVSRSHE